MTTLELVGRLRRLGVTIVADGGELRCRAPHGVLTPALLADLRERKAEVLAFVVQAGCPETSAPQAIPLVSRDDGTPLTFEQQRLWFLDQLAPGSRAYNIVAAASLAGRLDVAALQQALTLIVARHEALRTVFRAADGKPAQVVLPPADVPLPVVHPEPGDTAGQESGLPRAARELAGQPFDLAHGPLFRAHLLRLAEERYVLLLAMHHIVADGWSVGILGRELASAYTALVTGRRPQLPELAVQYADYAAWQRQRLSGAALERLVEHWRRHLAGSVGQLPLGTRRPHADARTDRGGRHSLALSAALTDALVGLTRRDGATLFMTVLSALYVLLARYTGERDLTVGFPIANRSHPQVERLIGFFANTLVLRQSLDGNPTFRDLARSVRHAALDAFAHQEMPFDHLTQLLHPDRDLGSNPMFSVMLQVQNVWLQSMELAGVRLRPLEIDSQIVKFDLDLALSERGGILQGWIQYRQSLFEAADIARMAGHLRTLLEGIAANPDARLGSLPLLTDEEKRRLVAAAPRSFSVERVDQLFDAQARRTPDRTAVVCNETRMTYGDLARRSTALATRLRTLDVGPDVPVAICLPRCADVMTAILATWKAGGAYLPLDPTLPRDRLAFMLNDAQPAVVLTHEAIAEDLPSASPRIVCLDTPDAAVTRTTDGEPATPNAEPRTGNPESRTANSQPRTANSEPRTEPRTRTRNLEPGTWNGADHLAYLIYTSGSTGAPKAVAISHRSLSNLLGGLHAAIYTHLGPAPRDVGLNGPLVFDTSVKQIMQVAHGHTLHVLPDSLRRDPAALLARLRDERLDVLDCTPSQLRLLVEAGLLEDLRCASLTMLVGGEPIDAALWQQLAAAPDRRFYNVYGPTECTVDATTCRVQVPADPTIGVPLANIRAYVVDRDLEPVPSGVAGELCIGGSGVGRGYYRRPALTADSFRPDPFSTENGARMYHTRDVVRRLPSGALVFSGRTDRMVKVRGNRVELQEIEQALGRHPGVARGAVIAREIRPGDSRLLAFVTSSCSPRPTVAALRAALSESLPGYMVPAEFVWLDALPMNENGKTDYRRLPVPEFVCVESEDRAADDAAAPRDVYELELTRIWKDLLRVGSIGLRDRFFHVGGDSLLAVLLMARIGQRLGRTVPLSALAHNPTIEQLAGVLRQDAGGERPSCLVAVQPDGSASPFFCVHPVGGNVLCYLPLAEALGPEQPFYGLQTGAIGTDQPTIASMAARYIDALRTVQPHGPYQLGGWSMGGIVAFEMAKQLQAAGELVGLVALLDSVAPGRHRADAHVPEHRILRWFGADLAARAGRDPRAFDAILAGSDAESHQCVLDAAVAGHMLPPDATVQELRSLLNVFVANLTAERAYRSRAGRFELTLVQSERTAERWRSEPSVGWSALTRRGVTRHVVPGDHYSIMRRPHVEAVAQVLSASLDDAAGQVPSSRVAASAGQVPPARAGALAGQTPLSRASASTGEAAAPVL